MGTYRGKTGSHYPDMSPCRAWRVGLGEWGLGEQGAAGEELAELWCGQGAGE